MATVLEMITRLRSRIGAPEVGSVDDGVLLDCLNTAYIQISNKYRFHKARKICTVDTIVGESRYNLPDDASVLLRLKNVTTGKKLGKIGDRRASEFASRSTPGVPEAYARYRGYFELTPTPDGVYTLEAFYKAGVVPLVSMSDIPVIPASWHHGIVLLARHVYYDEVANDFQKAAYAGQSYDKWVAEQPSEVDDEMEADMDSGVSVPTLTQGSGPRLDFDHSD